MMSSQVLTFSVEPPSSVRCEYPVSTAVSAQVMEDISSDYAKKTATLDPFPHASISAVGIHPCKHAETMKRLSDAYSSGSGKQLLVDQCAPALFSHDVCPMLEGALSPHTHTSHHPVLPYTL